MCSPREILKVIWVVAIRVIGHCPALLIISEMKIKITRSLRLGNGFLDKLPADTKER
jgi:hypothetical protein